MPAISVEWLASIQRGRSYGLDTNRDGYSIPIVPWIHPPLDEELQKIIKNVGITKVLEKGEPLFTHHERVSQLTLVTKGVTARHFGDIAELGGKAAAISVPGHIACGNLNFFTGRPAFGSYFTLSKAEVVFCPHNILLPILKSQTDLWEKLSQHMECCTLSDRIGLAAMVLLSVDLKMKCFVVSWAVHFGHSFERDGELWVRMPTPLTRTSRCLLANTSSVSVDNVLRNWKNDQVWVRLDNQVEFKVSAFEDAYLWMRKTEEPSLFHYPETLTRFFEIFDKE